MTSTELVESEIARFLSTQEPEVLCINGAWGVGKTFMWRSLLEQAIKNKTLKIGRYAYISLFGINSLEGLKHAAFENSDFLISRQRKSYISAALKRANRLFGWILASWSGFLDSGRWRCRHGRGFDFVLNGSEPNYLYRRLGAERRKTRNQGRSWPHVILERGARLQGYFDIGQK